MILQLKMDICMKHYTHLVVLRTHASQNYKANYVNLNTKFTFINIIKVQKALVLLNDPSLSHTHT